jgi:hypothetical protein
VELRREDTNQARDGCQVAGRWRPAADVLAFAVFLVVPLAASPWFWDQFTTVKWYALEALSVLWFLVEVWRCGSSGWPSFVRDRWPVALLLGLLVLGSCLRGGLAWAGPALLDRASFVLLTLAAFWYFGRNRGRTGRLEAATGIAASFVVAVGLAQAMGGDPLAYLAGGDHRSAFFGNVNMAAQFQGFAVVLLTAGSRRAGGRRALGWLREGLLALSVAWLYLLSCRSVLLGLSVAILALLLTKRLAARALARTLGLATMVVLSLLWLGPLIGPRSAPAPDPRPMADKATSTAIRLAVWRGTLGMIRDHPLGVGSANFGEAFIPYQLGLEQVSTGDLLFRTPHSELLRALAEEGIVFVVVVAFFLLSLLRALRRAFHATPEGSSPPALLVAGFPFLAVEAFFQFPFGTAYGCLMAAVLLGLALAQVDRPAASTWARAARWSWRLAGTTVAFAAAVLLARDVASEWLFVNLHQDLGAQDAACRLDPRNLPACVTAAWLQGAEGDRPGARARLVRVLEDAPYYHPAIRLLGEIAIRDGDRQGACLYLWVYDQLFRGRSAVHSRLHSWCGDTPPARLPAGATMPFYRTMPLAERDRVRPAPQSNDGGGG